MDRELDWANQPLGLQEEVELEGMDKDKELLEDIAGMVTTVTTDTMVVDMDMDIADEVDNVDDGVHELDEAMPKQGQEQLL